MSNLSELKKELIDRIEQGKVNFFVGAGISNRAPARLPTGPELTQQLLQAWVLNSDAFALLKRYAHSGTLRLEVVMQFAHDTFSDRTIVLSPLLSILDASPNCNHYLLAFALRRGCSVITTNFDVLTEIAYWNLYGTVPQVVVSDSQFEGAVLRGSLIKLHGTVATVEKTSNGELVVQDARETIIAALGQVARGLGDIKTRAFHQLLQQAPTLVWGYSCMDDFDILPALSTRSREPIYWVFFERGKQVELLSEDSWNSLISHIYSHSRLEDPKRFEVANVSSTLSSEDRRLYGDISQWIEHLVDEVWHLRTQKGFETQINRRISAFRRSQKGMKPPEPRTWEAQLLAARLLGQVGEWGDKMHSLYSSVYNSVDLEPDFRLKIRIEHAERTAPNDLVKASEILGISQIDDEGTSDGTRAYALAILSNIKRRQKQKDAGSLIQAAVAISQRGNVSEQTSYLISHYQALVIHQDVAEEVRRLGRDSKLTPEFLAKIDECEQLFSKGSAFFKGQGLVDYFAMSQNGLALLLIEKGRALKTVDRIEEANTVFKSATDILQENVAAVRMRYGFFRGVGQAFRNIALARQEQEDYEGALNALEQSAYFYSMVKPTPPETDLFEVFYRQAEILVKANKPEKALQPALRWILQKRAFADWHDEARGLKVLAEALRSRGFYLDAGYAAKVILGIYHDVLSDETKQRALKIRRFGPENARENLTFVLQLARDRGEQAQEQEASALLKQLNKICNDIKGHSSI